MAEKKHKDIALEYTAFFESNKKDEEVMAWIARPANSTYQEIKGFEVSHKPENIYFDKSGNEILFFRFKNQKKIKLNIQINARLYKWLACKTKNKEVELRPFLKSEPFLEQILLVKNLAKKITFKQKETIEKIKAIFDFVTQNFKYCYPVKNRGVGELIPGNLRGDCAEYSGLFVAICRALKIPARNETGFVLSLKHNKAVEHGWASLHLKGYGWVDFDTQYASQEKRNSKKYFGRRDDYRISFVKGFNIQLSPKIPRGFDTSYFKKAGVVVSKNKIQTLQPIFFASKNKIKFSEQIKIKK